MLSMLLGHPGFYSVVAEANGKVVGSNSSAQPVVAFDPDDSVGQDARRACDVDVG